MSASIGPRGLPKVKPSAWQYNLLLNWNWTFFVHSRVSCLSCVFDIDNTSECWLMSMVSSRGILSDECIATENAFDYSVFSKIDSLILNASLSSYNTSSTGITSHTTQSWDFTHQSLTYHSINSQYHSFTSTLTTSFYTHLYSSHLLFTSFILLLLFFISQVNTW